MVNVTRLVTQPPRHIIKHTSLQNLRTDDSLAINNHLVLVVNVWSGGHGRISCQMWVRLPAPDTILKRFDNMIKTS